jgi:hypothetical protein
MESRQSLRRLLSCFVVASSLGLVAGCASTATESGYVFAPENAIDNPFHQDPFCENVHSYKDGRTPNYFAKYRPEANLSADIQLIAPRQINRHSVGPGLLVPLPVVPDPVGNGKAANYRSAPERQFDKVVIAVYPKPFRVGYFFTPSQVWLETGGKALHPVKISRHYTHNYENREKLLDIVREKLPAQSGEFNAYVLEFNVKDIAGATMKLHIAGFDHQGVIVPGRVFNLLTNQVQVFDWKYDTDCNM